MASPSWATFKGIHSYTDTQIMTNIENNLKMWLDWSFLNIGSWTDVTGYSATYYGNPAQLNWVNDPNYVQGQVWQSARKDWVWESGGVYGLYNNTLPVDPTGLGIYVSGKKISPTNYYINYPLGRVIFTGFNGGVYPTAIVSGNYSYRNVQIYKADDAPWWKELQYGTLDSKNSQFIQNPQTGDWSLGSYQRIQLPAIVIETVPRGRSTGYEMGNQSLTVEQDVLFHVYAEDRATRNDIISTIFLQNDRYIYLFDSNIINSGQLYPLNSQGSRINGLLYPDLVSDTGFRGNQYQRARLSKNTMSEAESINTSLWEGVIRSTLEVVFYNM